MKEVLIDGVTYVEKKADSGNRYIVVIDRGWIYAGDVTRENGRIYLENVVWVFRWESIGFDGVIKNPKDENLTLRKIDQTIEIPERAEIYSVKVDDYWGL